MSSMITRSRAYSQPNQQVAASPFFGKSTSDKKLSSSTGKKPKQFKETEKETEEEMEGQGGQQGGQQGQKEIVNPEDVSPQQWLDMFNNLNNTLGSLQTQIKELNSMKGTVDSFSTWKQSLEQGLTHCNNKIDSHDHQIRLLTNIVINQEEKIRSLENRSTAAYQREKRANMIIHGIIEAKNETRAQLNLSITQFFQSIMEIEDEIEIADAYRIGDGRVRSIMIKLAHPSDKSLIYSNASNLQGKENARKKLYFIQEDMSDIQQEQKAAYRDLVQENKTKDAEDQLKIKMRRGNIVVNNEVVRPRVKPPQFADILRLSQHERDEVKAVKTVSGPEHIEKGSEFFSYACKVKKVDDVEKAYKKLRIKFADATHIICSYRLDQPTGPYRQEAVDDGDWGMARSILKVLKQKDLTQMCVFVVRYFGNVHLGKRRFEIVESLADRVTQAWYRKV